MTARFALWLLAVLCGVSAIIRGRADGLALLAVVFATLAILAGAYKQKEHHQ